MTTPKQAYRLFLREFPFCWGCGRSAFDRPEGWYGPFRLERHHVVSSTRVEDPRAIVTLCIVCHKTAHGDRLFMNGKPWHLPKLERCHLLFLKKAHDPTRYDRPWMQLHISGTLPRAVRPPNVYVAEYQSRQLLWV